MVTILQGTGLSHDVAIVRDKNSSLELFRNAVKRIGIHLAVEATKLLPGTNSTVTTPLATTEAIRISGSVVVVPVLRAGLGMLDSFLQLIPQALVGYVGMKRDETTLAPFEYYKNLPPSDSNTTFIVIDPMLATGGSMAGTLNSLMELPHSTIICCSLIAAPEGLMAISKGFPNVQLVIGVLDDCLNDQGFIVPGLGDAGDRLFGT
ncbi:MAG: uracil phosphoribosyltransferase [Ignavibacteria bacterium]|nr:uracil phosphoribosyltransferase [Ignavibacteria bacterium]